MNANILNRLSANNGTPLFKYERPTFNGFGFVEEPDERVVDVIEDLLDKLKNGYVEPSNEGLRELKNIRKQLENEATNGYDETLLAWKNAQDELTVSEVNSQKLNNRLDELKAVVIPAFDEKRLTDAEVKLAEGEKNYEAIKKANDNAIAKIKPVLVKEETALNDIQDQIKDWEAKPASEEKTKALKSLNDRKKPFVAKIAKYKKDIDTFHDKIQTAKKQVRASEELVGSLRNEKVVHLQKVKKLNEDITEATRKVDNAEIANIEIRANEDKKHNEHENRKYLIASELREVTQAIEDAESKGDNSYFDIFSIENLMTSDEAQNVRTTSFQAKIGSDSNLNNLLLLVSGKTENTRLSYNANLLLKKDLILKFIFLRTYYNDGLRDENAIFSRIIDENEGGMKYLYDYIIEKVVAKIIDDKKLNK